MKNKSILVISVSIIALANVGYVVAQKKATTAIKPTTAAVQSDEQQAIAAVRKAKQSVVNIIPNNQSQVLSVEEISYGTGFVVSSDGYIASNKHVIPDEKATYTVMFGEGQRYQARVIGVDKFSDLALLKIETSNIPAISFADSNALETGQSVFAIGNSLGRYQNTVTRGVVSGVGRNISINNGVTPRYQNLIQTDASINPGNSGGPLIDLTGKAIGMNTLIDTSGQGVGFAIPATTIQESIKQLKANGKVSRAYLGVSFLGINKNLAALLNNGVTSGALITAVAGGGPASKAGLVPQDIILEVDGRSINERNELDIQLVKYSAGSKVNLLIFREGKKINVEIVLSEFK